MSFTPPNHSDFVQPSRSNMPVCAPDSVGEGWWEVGVGEVVKTHYQYLSFHPRVEWKLSAYFTNEKLINDGRATYRAPSSIRAWIIILFQLPKKLWRHYVKKEI